MNAFKPVDAAAELSSIKAAIYRRRRRHALVKQPPTGRAVYTAR